MMESHPIPKIDVEITSLQGPDENAPTSSLTIGQVLYCTSTIRQYPQISFPFGKDAIEPRASSVAISSLRKTKQPSVFLRYGLEI
ncbi:hypothetical protein TNCV_3916001 [Trichonephila clavipes]|nr:hypothetical protein TNCV_3916001 [Trichonephila clavipes]